MCIFLKLCLPPTGQKHFQIVDQILGNPRRKQNHTAIIANSINDSGKDREILFFKRYYAGKKRQNHHTTKDYSGIIFPLRVFNEKKNQKKTGEGIPFFKYF